MDFFNKYRNLIPFIGALFLIVYFLPREGKFQYEFQKGKVWQHNTLTAPFDFPIYKTEGEIDAEKRQVISSLVPYYKRDNNVGIAQQNELSGAFRSSLQATMNHAQNNLSEYDYNYLIGIVLPEIKQVTTFIYSKGIREPNSVAESHLSVENAKLVVLDGNVATDFSPDEVFTPQSAYQYLSNHLQPLWDEGSAEHAFFIKLDAQSYLKPNLFFNERLTGQAREQRIASISPTQGMVSAGQQIVAQGEVVNSGTYRILTSFRHEYEQRVGYSGNTWLLLLGQFLIVLFFLSSLYLYIALLDGKTQLSFKKNSFIMLLVISFFFLTLWISKTSIANIYVIPFAVVPIFICTFFNPRLALITHFTLTLLAAFIVPNSFEFCLITYFVGIAATYSTKDVYQRGKLYRTALTVFGAYVLMFITLTLIKDGNLTFTWRTYFWFAINAGLIIAAHQLVYVFEKIFGFTSDNTLMEISDTNNSLLRELAEVAPATFQHCMQVANLAESVIREIGGNPLLVRTGALYHDIGKMNNPIYFVENQTSDFSPHQHLEPDESARIIVQHVTDGVAIARKNRLPEVIVRFIRTHHGSSLVRYFFHKYKQKYPDATDFSAFQYPGPNPSTKEQGVLMMADAVEAASRTLPMYTTEAIDELVESVVSSQVNGKMLDNTDLTFNDITTAKTIFKKKLRNIYHDRVVANG